MGSRAQTVHDGGAERTQWRQGAVTGCRTVETSSRHTDRVVGRLASCIWGLEWTRMVGVGDLRVKVHNAVSSEYYSWC